MRDDKQRFMEKVDASGGCWLWRCASVPMGYGRFYFRGKPRYAHRVALELLRGITVPDDKLVMHSCDNPRCVNPDHLSVGSQFDNMRDASAKGRTVNVSDWQGTRNPKAKLSEEQRAKLRCALIDGGATTRELAVEFGVTQTRVQQIARELRTQGFLR